MCGIIGFVGNEPAAPILLDGLERMEYRGYDSAGVAVRSETAGLQVRKTKGRLKVLSDLIHGGADLEGNLGIGHTRWATHGEPNDINAHPHVSENGRIALVHNGIIENYLELKEHLMRQGVRFTSDTDTEVVAQLLEFHYNECHNMLEAVGRRHTARQTVEAYEQAVKAGFDDINMDLIAGLPADDAAGFADSIRQVLDLNPSNITVHTLALKKGANLFQNRTALPSREAVGQMLHDAEQALRAAGIRFEKNGQCWTIPGGQRYAAPGRQLVEGDWSNAAFFLCMGALSRQGVCVSGLDPASLQADRAITEILTRFGAEVNIEGDTVTVRRGTLRGITLDAGPVPDLVPVVSVLAALCAGNILLTTGSHTLSIYAKVIEPERLFVRVLPTHQALDLCAAAGMVQSHVIAMQGPFSRDFNAALYDQLRIRTMVSKDSGQPGGVADKVLPALERGIDVVMIERPKEDKR